MSQTIRAVERALDILLCFSRQTPELTMTQIAERVGLYKSTVHRLLATLEGRRFVQRDPDTGIYQPGVRLLQIAYLTLEHNNLRRLAVPFLLHLWEQQHETIDLAVLDDTDVVFLDVLESPRRVKLAAAIGQRLPAHSTASGKAILAFMPEETVRRIFKDDIPQFTQYTLCSPEALFEDLRHTREQGFALSLEEYEEGINAVAAPILNLNGQPIGAVAVAGPAYRFNREQMIEIAPLVLATVRDIAQEVEMATYPQINTRS
ncbi:MAG: IclR family transcriptional regulator [Anaerolineae bacterium]|nr:IclR family transcriptional regulator [Anaerolineae bacterium]